MYRNLHFKIILIFVVFTIVLMATVGSVLFVNIYNFYNSDFNDQMEQAFSDDGELVVQLKNALSESEYYTVQSELLKANQSALGINRYRNYYVIAMDGTIMASSDEYSAGNLEMTKNIIAGLTGSKGVGKQFWTDYIDYAYYISDGSNASIIYIRDSQDYVRQFSEIIFQIIITTIFIGMLISIALSFFLSKAIADPIGDMTRSAEKITEGEFTEEIKIRSKDEIGTLGETFNYMRSVIKNTLDEVSGERQKFETLFLYLNDAVLAFDSEGKPMHVNKMASELFNIDDQMHDFSFSQMMKWLQINYKEVSEGYRENRNYVVRDVLYGEKAFDVTFAEFKYTQEEKDHVGIMCVIHDNTGRYELDKSRREFVADVSHELRTPLTSIKGAVETVLEYPQLDQESKDNFLKMAVSECDRMTRIVSDLLVLSRLDNNGTNWQIVEFAPSEMAKQVYDMLSVEANRRSQHFEFNCDSGLKDMVGDKEKLQQVLINIVSNSVKYTPDGGTIKINVRPEGDFVAFVVSDTGMGIPEEDLPRIFERFYRVEKARSSDRGGTGLGLAIAKEITEAHGGNISIKSKVGEGTEIAIRLPYVATIAAPKKK